MQDELRRLLVDARALVARPANDFTWSSWRDHGHALAELDDLIERCGDGGLTREDCAVLFVPTGPICEVAVSSGWGDAWVALGDRFDALSWRGGPC